METVTPITVEFLKDNFGININDAELYIDNLIKEPTKPKKPVLPSGASSAIVEEYLSKLKDYENLKSKYDDESKSYNLLRNEYVNILEDYIKDCAGMENVPEKQRDKVWWMAWERANHDYPAIYSHLVDLVDLFI